MGGRKGGSGVGEKEKEYPDIEVDVCKPNTLKAKAEGWPAISKQPGLYSETFSPKRKIPKNTANEKEACTFNLGSASHMMKTWGLLT